MMGILDLYFKSQLRVEAEKNAKGKPPIPRKNVISYDTDESKLNDSVEGGKTKKEADINKMARPCFYTAVALTDALVFSIPLDLIDKLPNDVFQTVK